jgi:hypothetical protein
MAAPLLNETCLNEQDATFWYDFGNDCASQKASNLVEFLSAMRAFAQPVEELYSKRRRQRMINTRQE